MYLDWSTPIKNLPLLLSGAKNTLILTLVIFAIAFVISLPLAIIRYNKKPRLLYWFSSFYVELFRNIPGLVVLFMAYFGLPQFHIYLSKNAAGIGTISIVIAAYMTEIIRAGIESVSKGQWEAAACIGFSKFRIFRLIIMPQALKNVFPALGNQLIMTMYSTAVLSAIDIRELTQQATILNSRSFRTFEIYVVVTGIYIIMSLIMQYLIHFSNKKLLRNG